MGSAWADKQHVQLLRRLWSSHGILAAAAEFYVTAAFETIVLATSLMGLC